MSDDEQDLIALTAEIVSVHVANNSVHTSEVAPLIGNVFKALSSLGAQGHTANEEAKPQPATTVRKSLSSPNHIISMIDGKPYKILRRHISLHGYTPESYREAFGLPKNYPMVAPDYAEHRRALAHKIGLGRKPKAEAAKTMPKKVSSTPAPATVAETPNKRTRRTLKPVFSNAVAAAKEHLGGE